MQRGPEVFIAHRFHIEMDGISRASFVRCSGLASRRTVLVYREGGNETAHKLRGPEEHSNILLESGVTLDRSLFDWYVQGDRRDGAVILLGPGGEEVLRWSFSRAWPCRWQGPRFDAEGSAVALEVLEISHEGIVWTR